MIKDYMIREEIIIIIIIITIIPHLSGKWTGGTGNQRKNQDCTTHNIVKIG